MAAPATPPTGLDTSYSAIQYNGKNLWICNKFTDFTCDPFYDVKQTPGNTYIQTVTSPKRYRVEAHIKKFQDVSRAYVEGEAASLFTVAWKDFKDWAATGTPFEFWRNCTDSGEYSHFTYCVLNADKSKFKLLIGNVRYSLDMTFATEGAAR
jgi:hypothetical protein